MNELILTSIIASLFTFILTKEYILKREEDDFEEWKKFISGKLDFQNEITSLFLEASASSDEAEGQAKLKTAIYLLKGLPIVKPKRTRKKIQ